MSLPARLRIPQTSDLRLASMPNFRELRLGEVRFASLPQSGNVRQEAPILYSWVPNLLTSKRIYAPGDRWRLLSGVSFRAVGVDRRRGAVGSTYRTPLENTTDLEGRLSGFPFSLLRSGGLSLREDIIWAGIIGIGPGLRIMLGCEVPRRPLMRTPVNKD